MKISREYERITDLPLEKIDSENVPRNYFIVRGDQMYVTNGHYVLVIPVEKEEGEGNFVLPKDFVAYAKKITKKNYDMEFIKEKNTIKFIDGTIKELPVVTDIAMNNFHKVVKKIIAGVKKNYKKVSLAKFGINVEILYKVARALNSNLDGGTSIAVWSKTEKEKPEDYSVPIFIVRPLDNKKAWAFILPIKSYEEDYYKDI